MKNLRKTVILPILILALMIVGCGSKETVMKEFTSEDGTVSVTMNENWNTENLEDMGIGTGGWVIAYNRDGSEGILVLQFAKDIYGADIADMDAWKARVESIYPMSGMDKTENPNITGMDTVDTFSCEVTADGESHAGRILFGETEYAYYCILYLAPKIDSSKIEYYNQVCASFKEAAPEIESVSYGSDTVQWFNNTCAILTASNGWDYTIFGGLAANDNSRDIIQSLLSEWWEVTDRETADDTMDWLLTEGHRDAFAKDMQDLADAGIADVSAEERKDFILENFNIEEEQAQEYADWYAFYEQYGADAIAAWDYSRAMSLLGNYYLAGYYTEEEALDKALETAQTIQAMFDSWDGFMESYFAGYEYWAEDSSEERRKLYADIKAAPDNPYNLEWNMTLKKDW